MNLGPSSSHIPKIRQFGLRPRKPHIGLAEPRLGKIKINPSPVKQAKLPKPKLSMPGMSLPKI